MVVSMVLLVLELALLLDLLNPQDQLLNPLRDCVHAWDWIKVN